MTTPAVMNANRFEWERLVRRIVMPAPVKLVAFVLATFADPNGTRVRPGRDVLVAITGYSERSIVRKLNTLKEMNLIELVTRGGGRGGKGRTSEYRLTIPIDLLDRYEMLPPGERGPLRRAVDNSESGATQVARQSPRAATNEVPTGALSGRMRCQPGPIEVPQLWRTTRSRPSTTETRPTGLHPQATSPPRATAAATTPILLDSGNKVSEFEAAS